MRILGLSLESREPRSKDRGSLIFAQNSPQSRNKCLGLFAQNRNRDKLVLILIFIVISFLRFYRAGELFYFAADEDILALSAKRILIDHQAQFTGFPIPGGLFIGSAFYYLMAIFYFLVYMNPLGLPIVSAFFSIFTTFLVYLVAKTIFEKQRIGIFAAIIYGISFLAGVYSHVLTSLFLAPILAVSMYWVLYKLTKERKNGLKLYTILGLLISLALQNEGSSFSLIALLIIFWLISRFRVTKLQAVWACFIVFVTHLPFLIYDWAHNFFFVKSDLFFFLKNTSILKPYDSGHLSLSGAISSFQLLGQTFGNFLFGSQNLDISEHYSCVNTVREGWLLPVLISFLLVIILFNSFRRKAVLGLKIVSAHLLVLLAGLFLYQFFAGRYLYEWTLFIFFPGFAMIFGYFFDWVFMKGQFARFVATIFLVLFVFINVRQTLMSKNNYGLKNKVEAVRFAVSETGNQPFYLESLGCNRHGYLYLFWYFGHLPEKTVGTGEFFVPRLIDYNQETVPSTGVIIFDSKSTQEDGLGQADSSKQFGNIGVMITKDSRGDF